MSTVNVFVAGSRAVSRLNDAIRSRLDQIVAQGHHVIVGDANGADKAAQQFFAKKRYEAVTVFCTGTRCRNNVGNWPVVNVTPPDGVTGGFDFYAAKDRAMAARATHGFMLWDGESRGTYTNITNLLREHKPVLVYLSPSRAFMAVKTSSDLDELVAQRGRGRPFTGTPAA